MNKSITFESRTLDSASVETNSGQIPGVPKNPRIIDDVALTKLVKSVSEMPQLLSARPPIVVKLGDRFVAIAGNMRLVAAKEAGLKSIPCSVVTSFSDPRTLREIAIRDNVSSGRNEWQDLIDEWDRKELYEWGLEIPEPEKESEKEPGDSDPQDTVAIELTVPIDRSDETVRFLAANGYEFKVKQKKKRKSST